MYHQMMCVSLRRFCKGGGPSSGRGDSSSGGGAADECLVSRARVNIPKMRVEGAAQSGLVEVEIAGAGEGGQGKARVHGQGEAEASGQRYMKVVREWIDPIEEDGSLKRSRSEATTSAGRREAWIVNSSGSTTNRATINLEEEELPRKKVAMEVTLRLPGGQMATVMYRVGADAEMRKVIDKVFSSHNTYMLIFII